MYAMELNGSHVGKKAKIKWKNKTLTRKIRIVHHHPSGKVSVRPYSYNSYTYGGHSKITWELIPYNAEVEFVDDQPVKA